MVFCQILKVWKDEAGLQIDTKTLHIDGMAKGENIVLLLIARTGKDHV